MQEYRVAMQREVAFRTGEFDADGKPFVRFEWVDQHSQVYTDRGAAERHAEQLNGREDYRDAHVEVREVGEWHGEDEPV